LARILHRDKRLRKTKILRGADGKHVNRKEEPDQHFEEREEGQCRQFTRQRGQGFEGFLNAGRRTEAGDSPTGHQYEEHKTQHAAADPEEHEERLYKGSEIVQSRQTVSEVKARRRPASSLFLFHRLQLPDFPAESVL
jgi:hypothetical protein